MARIWPAVRWVTPETLEAPPGFEPGNKGFAGLCLTAWLRRQRKEGLLVLSDGLPLFQSGKPDSNRRPPPWQGGALPTELFPQEKRCLGSLPKPTRNVSETPLNCALEPRKGP